MRKILIVLLALAVVVGIGGFYIHGHPKKTAPKPEYPEYLNFGGNYVFNVPKDYHVDEQAVPGIQIVFTGQLGAKTLEDVYSANGMSLQQISALSDHSGKAFKAYVNETFLPDIKKNLSTNEVQLKFAKVHGWDVARITASKDGKQTRFIYLKNGQHPVGIISKEETEAFKKIEQTMVDVELSDLNNEQPAIKQSLQTATQLVKDQKAAELYNSAAPELRSKNTQADVANALQVAAPYIKDNVTISGITYNPGDIAAVLRFSSLNRDAQPTFGGLAFKKADGQWKLQQLSLPAPQNQQR